MNAKICGIKNTRTLKYLINHKYPPKYIGFICNYPKSHRNLNFKKTFPELEKIARSNWNLAEVTIFQRRNEMALVLEDPNGLTIESNFLEKFDWRFINGKILEILI
mgnify:CR=1 FL=1